MTIGYSYLIIDSNGVRVSSGQGTAHSYGRVFEIVADALSTNATYNKAIEVGNLTFWREHERETS